MLVRVAGRPEIGFGQVEFLVPETRRLSSLLGFGGTRTVLSTAALGLARL